MTKHQNHDNAHLGVSLKLVLKCRSRSLTELLTQLKPAGVALHSPTLEGLMLNRPLAWLIINRR